MKDKYLEIYDAHDGTSQRLRLNPGLLPDYFQIDGRTTTELVAFAVNFSEALIYHGKNGPTAESWKDFFIHDRLLYLYIIAHTDLRKTQSAFYKLYDSLLHNTDREDVKSQLPQLIDSVRTTLFVLAHWSSNTKADHFLKGHAVEFYLDFSAEQIKDIKEVYRLTLLRRQHTEAKKQWEMIDKVFSFKLAENAKKPVRKHADETLAVLKNTFETCYRLAEGQIKMARETIAQKNKKSHNVKPHIALFFGFLKIYRVLQGRINNITKRHLDYYYEDCLKVSPLGKQADDAFVRFDLTKDEEAYLLEEGAGVVAGKDASGTPLIYQTTHDVNLSKTKISAMHTVFVSQNPLNYSGLPNKKRITDIFCNKHDIHYSGRWDIFGEDQFFKAASEKTMSHARVGFIVASELLLLKEGERKIQIDFSATAESYDSFVHAVEQIGRVEKEDEKNAFSRLFNTAFDVFITLDGIETPFAHFTVINKPEINGFAIEMLLSDKDPALSNSGKIQTLEQPQLHTPYVKVLLRDESHIYAFPFIQLLDIENISINMEVEGVKDIMLFNNYGQIDFSKPFQVFGAAPKVGSYLLIGSREVFCKPITAFDVQINWYQLPSGPNGWSSYFADYKEHIENSDFEVNLEYLKSGVWEKVQPKSNFPLFEEVVERQITVKKLSDQTNFKEIEISPDLSESNISAPLEPYTPHSRTAYLKVELIGPDFAFGYDSYQKNLYKSIRENAKIKNDLEIREPNPPLSPLAKHIRLKYRAKEKAIEDKGPTHRIQLFSLGPFGYKERKLVSKEKTNKLLPDLQAEGHFMIGLDSYPKNGRLNIFMRMQLGNVESFIRKAPQVRWHYLKDNNWVAMPSNAIRFDGTHGLFQSGVISIQIPESISNKNTLIHDQLFWLKASVDSNSHIFPGILGIHTNVARVRWDGKSDGTHLAQALPMGSINKMQVLNPKIANVSQVMESVNGKVEESKTDYYKRVSERLRHKNRAVTVWDYERLVLQEFPYVFKVKCFNAVKNSKDEAIRKKYVEAGNILLLVVPDIQNPLVRNKLRPKLGISLLLRIRDYLQKLSSPFVKIEVRNPYYERVRVICKASFIGSRNSGFYITKLNNDIIDFLTPWVSGADVVEHFGNRLYRSKIMSFVQKRDYVDFVTSFSIVKTNAEQEYFHLVDTARKNADDEEILPEFPWSILTSVEQHDIMAIDDNKYREQIPRGIGNMKLGTDFIITEKK